MTGISGGGGVSPGKSLLQHFVDLMKESPRKLLRIVWAITGFYFLLSIPGFYHYWTVVQTARWPSVPGVILQSQTKIGYLKGMQAWLPDVKFKYSVNGHEYKGDRTCNLVHPAARDPTEAYVRQFPAGASVAVYYDPAAPENSLLRPGPTGEQKLIAHWVSPICDGFVLFCAILISWDLRRVIKKSEAGKMINP